MGVIEWETIARDLPSVESFILSKRSGTLKIANGSSNGSRFSSKGVDVLCCQRLSIVLMDSNYEQPGPLRGSPELCGIPNLRPQNRVLVANQVERFVEYTTCVRIPKSSHILHHEERWLQLSNYPKEVTDQQPAWILRAAPADGAKSLAGWPPDHTIDLPA